MSLAMRIGTHVLTNGLVLAPMAGVADAPFRALCRRLGADLAPSEMVSADPRLRDTRKSRLRLDHGFEPAPRSVQIAGSHPAWMADAARHNVERGAQIIDINMGCPAKKVCSAAAGSALLEDEPLVGRILAAVTGAVSVPVTLKIRTGPDPARRNAVRIAHIAEDSGVAALAVHGRTRACAFRGEAEHHTVREVKAAVGLPVLANGDIDSPARAQAVLRATGADGILVGRAACGDPWMFRRIAAVLCGRGDPGPVAEAERAATVAWHLRALHRHYGDAQGVRVARKHLRWYAGALPGARAFWGRICREADASRQVALAREFFRPAAPEGLAA